jgi:hypothetical protein
MPPHDLLPAALFTSGFPALLLAFLVEVNKRLPP